eukprot:COSAG05_NODE_7132_length_852_cov_1.262948_2_plen_63_part_00
MDRRVEFTAAGVPLFFEEWLEKLSRAGGRTTEGVFRIPGHTEDVHLLQQHYERTNPNPRLIF